MAKKEINIKINTDTGGSVKSINSLEKELGNLQDELKDLEVGSEVFNEMAERAKELEAELENVNLSFERLNPEQTATEIGSLASGLANTATGALALSQALGITNDTSEKFIEKIATGMAVAQAFSGGLQGIISMQKLLRTSTLATTIATQGGTVAMRIFNAVVKANPIMLLVGLLATAVSAFALFSSSQDEAAESGKELNEVEKELTKTIEEQSEAVKRNRQIWREQRELRQSLEQLKIERQLLLLNQDLENLRKETPENLEEINRKVVQIARIEMDLAQEKARFELEEFERKALERNEEMNDTLKQISLQKKIISDAKINRSDDLADELRVMAELEKTRDKYIAEELTLHERRSVKMQQLENDVLKVKIKNAKILRDLDKETFEEEVDYIKKMVDEWDGATDRIETNKVRTSLVDPEPTLTIFEIISQYYRELQEELRLIAIQTTDDILISLNIGSIAITSAFEGNLDSINDSFQDLNSSLKESMDSLIHMIEERAKFTKEMLIEMGAAVGQMIADTMASMFEASNKRALEATAERYRQEELGLKESLENRLITQKEYDAELKMLDKKREQEELIQKRKAFKQEKSMAIVSASIMTAQAILQALASMPPPFSFIMAGISAALGAAQIGIISSQKFKARSGGIVPKDGSSGHTDSVNALLAPGETVINAESSRMFAPQLDYMNQVGGGKSLMPSLETITTRAIDANTAYRNNEPQYQEIRAYVVEQDISESQTRADRFRKRAEFS